LLFATTKPVVSLPTAASEDRDRRTVRIVRCGRGERAHSLLFIQIFAGNVILRHLVRENFLLISVPSVFHARHYVGLERVSFLEQLVNTLRIRTLDAGQSDRKSVV